MQALLPDKEGVRATSGADLAAEQSAQIAENTGFLTKTLLIFAGIALFVGVFLIANTFTMLIAQRSREIALMRAVGASRRQVVRSVLVEAALLGLVASVAGFALGLGIATAMRPLLNTTGAGLPDGPLVISPAAPLASLAVGVLVTVLAAWLPSRRAAKIAPVAALSSVDQAPPARSLRIRKVLGTLLAGAGVLVMLYVSTLRSSKESNLMVAMLGSALALGGVIVLAPLLSRPLIALAGKVTTPFFGVGGKLAEQNALRNPRRTAATASALMIGLALITGLTVGGHSAESAMAKEATQGLTADYKVNQQHRPRARRGRRRQDRPGAWGRRGRPRHHDAARHPGRVRRDHRHRPQGARKGRTARLPRRLAARHRPREDRGLRRVRRAGRAPGRRHSRRRDGWRYGHAARPRSGS